MGFGREVMGLKCLHSHFSGALSLEEVGWLNCGIRPL